MSTPEISAQLTAFSRLTEREINDPHSISCGHRLLDTVRRWFPRLHQCAIAPVPIRFNERDDHPFGLPIVIIPFIEIVTDLGTSWVRNLAYVHAKREVVFWQNHDGEAFWSAIKLPKAA